MGGLSHDLISFDEWEGVEMSSIETVVFTGPDKSLLDRSARAAEAAAKALRWESILDSKRRKLAKLEYDRLMRDAHDLRLLGARLTKVARMLKTPAPAPVAQVVRSGVDRRVTDVPLSPTVPDRRVGLERRKS